MAGLIRKELPAVMSPAPRTRGRAQKKESPESSSLNSGGLRQNGGYLLSHLRSTIGVAKLNFSVRNGKRWDLRAITTLISFLLYLFLSLYRIQSHTYTRTSNTPLHVRKSRAISNARLWCRHLYTCILSTSSSLTTLREISSCGGLRT